MFGENSIKEPGSSPRTATQCSLATYGTVPCRDLAPVLHTRRFNHSGTNSQEIDFALVLMRTIDSVNNDPSLLRNVVYELARSKLLTLALEQDPRVSTLQLRSLLLSFETAIQHVERNASRDDALRLPDEGAGLITQTGFAKPIDRDDPIVEEIERTGVRKSYFGPTRVRNQHWNWRRAAAVFTASLVVMVVGIASAIGGMYFGKWHHMPSLPTASVVAKSGPQKESASPATEARRVGLPTPNVYGIYAVSGGELYELEALPGRVPDPRVMMSTPVKIASKTILPNGRLAFIVFRRDVSSSAPDRVSVRVIAKIVRGMSFDSDAKANVSALDDQWSIRGASYDLRVAPLNDNPELRLLQPENSEFVFPAGRYGLVLKGQAFDFSVAGTITEPVQCLERVAAANGNFYSECRSL